MVAVSDHRAEFSLEQRYTQQEGTVLLSGIQALVRALLSRRALDAANGLDTGGFISGYRGSPLGGLDKELWAQEAKLEPQNIKFQPGVNEDLAATAVWGTQHVGLRPGASVDGVFGMWYGKAPGLDRSCDAIRHANMAGTARNGGVLLVVGDDPASKSSSLATQSDHALQAMGVPVLAPSDVQDVHDFAVAGWALSRFSGCWVALKAIADQMDSSATIDISPARLAHLPAVPGDSDVSVRLVDSALAQEERLLVAKLPAAIDFARAAEINRWVTQNVFAPQRGRLGIVTAGQAYRDLREALSLLGLESLEQIREQGIEILKLGMTWPIDERLVQDFANRVDEVLVLEEKRPFVEPQVKTALYGAADVPVHGKSHANGRTLFNGYGELSVARIARVLLELLDLPETDFFSGLRASERELKNVVAPAKDERTPLFCAGCPHNTSTRVPDGSRAVAGIGCHYMVQWMDRATNTFTQMGGEGTTWVGEAPFTDEEHIFANLGDGTYFHSGVLAIRQAVAAGANITYKILFNDAVAMTGGQPTDGELTVPDLVKQFQAENVASVCVVSDAPEELTGLDVPVHHRRELDRVQRELRETSGVTALIYKQSCATELRRKRKRGLIEDTKPRLMINEAVCDGCGDCSVQSNCVAVEPTPTPFGTKRKINQTMCNKDLSCAEGFCPAFVEVAGELKKPQLSDLGLDDVRRRLVEPRFHGDRSDVIITGVGGTGIVTLGALLAVAAKIDGKTVRTLDMTGLAQKGGAVFSHVRIAGAEESIHTAKIPQGQSDVLVACDLVTAATNEALALLGQDTLACVNTHVSPTADFVLHQNADVQLQQRLRRVRKMVGCLDTVASADAVEAHLGDTAQANVFLLGFAYQSGRIPLTLDAIEQAIRLNGVQVERNLMAFNLGRLARSEPEALTDTPEPAGRPRDLANVIELHTQHLRDYDHAGIVERYRAMVEKVRSREESLRPGSEQLTRAVAESYAKLLAIKDEYEVARLYLSPLFAEQVADQFESDSSVRYLLAPPLFGSKKRRFGGWMRHGFRVLHGLRGLRNTWLDPFRYTRERKLELGLIDHYERVVREVLVGLSVQNYGVGVAIAKLPLEMRGFGHVKEAQVATAMVKERTLLEEFRSPPSPVRFVDPRHDEAA